MGASTAGEAILAKGAAFGGGSGAVGGGDLSRFDLSFGFFAEMGDGSSCWSSSSILIGRSASMGNVAVVGMAAGLRSSSGGSIFTLTSPANGLFRAGRMSIVLVSKDFVVKRSRSS